MELLTFEDYSNFANECRISLFDLRNKLKEFNANNTYNPLFEGNWYTWRTRKVEEIEKSFFRFERKLYLESFNVGDFDTCEKMFLIISRQ